MRRSIVIALLALGLTSRPASALEIKNLRSTYGAFGAARSGNQVLPGDMLWLSFDIEDLKMEAASGLVRYAINLEVVDSNNKSVFSRKNPPNQRYLALGKAVVADRAQVITGTDQDPGKYTVRLTVIDEDNKEKTVNYPFEILKADFGLIHGVSPSVAVTNQEFTAYCALAGMQRDGKGLPNVDVSFRIVDDKGQSTLPKPFLSNVPKILPEEFDIKKEKIVPLPFPIYLNRAGRFTIEIEATDQLSKKTSRISFPLLVYEPSAVSAK